jgi:phosphate transport system permease protein
MAVETVPGPFSGPMAGPSGPGAAASAAIKKSIKRRYAAERRFRLYGVAAILFGLSFLAVLFGSIVSTGYTAFVQSSFELNVLLDRAVIDPDGKRDQTALMTADYTLLAKKALASAVGADPGNKVQMREIGALLSRDVDVEIRKVALADPALIGKTVPIWVLASGRVDSLMKGQLDRNLPAQTRKISDQQLAWIDKLTASGALAKRFNTGLFTNGASSNPETAGIGVAMVGSLFMMITVLLLAVPLGVAAAVYLQEFARTAGRT